MNDYVGKFVKLKVGVNIVVVQIVEVSEKKGRTDYILCRVKPTINYAKIQVGEHTWFWIDSNEVFDDPTLAVLE